MMDPVGYPTIGWGSRTDIDGKEVTMKTKAHTLSECDMLLARDCRAIETYLSQYELNQNQFDALASFAYNCGIGALEKSTLMKNIKSGKPVTLENFTVYSRARDQKTKQLVVLKGLLRRRKIEFALFFQK